MTSSDVNQLLEEAKCVGCIGASASEMVLYGLLSRILSAIQNQSSMNIAYAQLSNRNTLPVANITIAYPVVWTDVDGLSGMTVSVGASSIYVSDAGTYLVSISAIVDCNPPSTSGTMDMWIRVNGADLQRSNTIVAVPAANTESVLAVTFLLTLADGDYFQLYFRGSNTNMVLKSTPAAIGPPARPLCPSVIVAVHRVI